MNVGRPDLDGIEATPADRRRGGPGVKVLVLTAYDTGENIVEVPARGRLRIPGEGHPAR
ncbi:hypothetical protein GCM10017687_69820 [Streptomyces echinatus]